MQVYSKNKKTKHQCENSPKWHIYLNASWRCVYNFQTSRFTSLQRAHEGGIWLQPTQLTRMWRLGEQQEEEKRGKAFPKSSFPWKKKKGKEKREWERWRVAAVPLTWQQSSNDSLKFLFPNHKYVFFFFYIITDTSNATVSKRGEK